MRIDDYFTAEEKRLMDTLKGKSLMEQDEIIYEYERNLNNANTL